MLHIQTLPRESKTIHHIKKMLNKRKYYIFSVVEILEENFIYPETGGFLTTSFDKHSNCKLNIFTQMFKQATKILFE